MLFKPNPLSIAVGSIGLPLQIRRSAISASGTHPANYVRNKASEDLWLVYLSHQHSYQYLISLMVGLSLSMTTIPSNLLSQERHPGLFTASSRPKTASDHVIGLICHSQIRCHIPTYLHHYLCANIFKNSGDGLRSLSLSLQPCLLHSKTDHDIISRQDSSTDRLHLSLHTDFARGIPRSSKNTKIVYLDVTDTKDFLRTRFHCPQYQ